MFFIAYAFKGQMHEFAGRVKIVSHSSCRTSAILIFLSPGSPEATLAKMTHCWKSRVTAHFILVNSALFAKVLIYLRGIQHTKG